MDSSATDSGTEDVLETLIGSFQKKYQDHTRSRDERPPRQYKAKKLDSDGDWLAQRSGSDLRTGRQHKVIFVSNAPAGGNCSLSVVWWLTVVMVMLC